MLLLGSVVFTLSRNAQPQEVAVEPKTGVGVRDGDRRVVDPEKHLAGLRLPFRVAFAGGKMKDFKRVSVGIFEIKSFDAAGVLVPIRQPLRTGRGMFHIVFPQNRIGAVHVADDDREVLEPQVVAAGIDGNRAAARSEKLYEFDRLAAEAHAHNPGARTEHAKEMLQLISRDFRVSHLFEREYAGIKLHRAVHVGDGGDHGADTADMNLPACGGGCLRRSGKSTGGEQRCRKEEPEKASRPHRSLRLRSVAMQSLVQRSWHRTAPASDRRCEARWP